MNLFGLVCWSLDHRPWPAVSWQPVESISLRSVAMVRKFHVRNDVQSCLYDFSVCHRWRHGSKDSHFFLCIIFMKLFLRYGVVRTSKFHFVFGCVAVALNSCHALESVTFFDQAIRTIWPERKVKYLPCILFVRSNVFSCHCSRQRRCSRTKFDASCRSLDGWLQTVLLHASTWSQGKKAIICFFRLLESPINDRA